MDAPRGAVNSFCQQEGISRKTFYVLRARALAEGEAETRTTRALGRVIEVGRADGGLRPDLAVSDLYILMVFQPGDAPAVVRRRWLELLRSGLLGPGASG